MIRWLKGLICSAILAVAMGTFAPVSIADTSDSLTSATVATGNSYCPVMPEEKIDPAIFTTYQGETVYFCCNRCRRDFIRNPLAYVANLSLSSMPTTAAAAAEHPEHEHDAPVPEAHDPSELEHSETTLDHDHSVDHASPPPASSTSLWDKGMATFGKFHPLVVHFPITLLLTAALAELLALRFSPYLLHMFARFNLGLGALGALVAAPLGWAAAASANYPQLEQVLLLHRWMGTSTAVLAVILLILAEFGYRHSRPGLLRVYRTLLALTVVVVALTGHFGSTLIYGSGYFFG